MPNEIIVRVTFDTPEITDLVIKILCGNIYDEDADDRKIINSLVTEEEWKEKKEFYLENGDFEENILRNEWEIKYDIAVNKLKKSFDSILRCREFWDFSDDDAKHGKRIHREGCSIWTCHAWHPYYEVYEELNRVLNIHIILDVDIKRSEWWANEDDPPHVEYTKK